MSEPARVLPFIQLPKGKGFVTSMYATGHGATFEREQSLRFKSLDWEDRIFRPLEGWGSILLRWAIRGAGFGALVGALIWLIKEVV